MLHQKNAVNPTGKVLSFAAQSNTPQPTLVPAGHAPEPGSARRLILQISAKKCSSFLAEAAVLVLVFALLDRLVVKDRMDLSWAMTAVGISVALLAGSIVLEFASRRWHVPS